MTTYSVNIEYKTFVIRVTATYFLKLKLKKNKNKFHHFNCFVPLSKID